MSKLSEVLKKVQQNTKKGSKTFYRPLSKEDSATIRKFYKDQLNYLSFDGCHTTKFKNASGTLVANGFNRVVIGDYGAYVEFTEDQIELANIKSRWPGKPSRPVKYIWMETTDDSKTKVYHQKGTVSYADYKVGMYYIDPNDLIT